MKIYPLIVCLFCGFFSIGQKSYYFSDPQPAGSTHVKNVDERFHGRYASSNGSLIYEIGPEGIRTVATNISSIDRATLRESSQYEVRNGHIFGVVAGDSLPCVLEDERYYFGVRNRDWVIADGASNVLSRLSSNEYVMNYSENGTFIPAIFSFKGSQLEVHPFDYDIDTEVFDAIPSNQNGQNMIILSPSAEEFATLRANGIFEGMTLYKKELE